jgi:hypothetical protein
MDAFLDACRDFLSDPLTRALAVTFASLFVWQGLGLWSEVKHKRI